MSAPKRQRSAGGFTQVQIKRVLGAAEAAGFNVRSFEIRPDGAMSVSRASEPTPSPDPFELWKAKRDAREA